MHAAALQETRLVEPRFLRRVVIIVTMLAALSICVSLGGTWLGRTITLAGHTDDRTEREIVIGNDVLRVPSNAIRFDRLRRDGVATRLDLYLQWPSMEGYSNARQDAFNHRGRSREIVFLTFEEAAMSRDMTNRFEPIYAALIEPAVRPIGHGVAARSFKADAGYRDEELMVHEGSPRLVARCLTAAAGADSLAPCERDIHLGRALSLTYRFPRALLADWPKLDAAIRLKAESYLSSAER